MKKFMQFVLEWKTSASLFFTASVSLYLFFALWKGLRQTPVATLWGLLWMSLAGSLLQSLCFSFWVFKKLRYAWRSLLFVLLFLPTLALIAWKTKWFPLDQAGAWALFLSIFFYIFIVMTIGFEVYFRLTGKKYDGIVSQYRSQSGRPDGHAPF